MHDALALWPRHTHDFLRAERLLVEVDGGAAVKESQVRRDGAESVGNGLHGLGHRRFLPSLTIELAMSPSTCFGDARPAGLVELDQSCWTSRGARSPFSLTPVGERGEPRNLFAIRAVVDAPLS